MSDNENTTYRLQLRKFKEIIMELDVWKKIKLKNNLTIHPQKLAQKQQCETQRK